jgi:hypothetical protein
MRPAPTVLVVSLSVLVSACGARADLESVGGSGGEDSAGAGASSGNGSGTGAAGGTGAGSGAGGGSGGTTPTGSGGTTTGGSGTTTGSGTGSTTGAGTGGSTGTGTGPQICPDFGDACTECLAVSCPETYCNCYENSECFALFQCGGPCDGDPQCVEACYAEHQDGISDAALVSDCAAVFCPDACPGFEGSQVDPCTKCILKGCEAEMNACLAEPACLQLYECLTACPPVDLMCQDGCYNKYSSGIPSLQTLLTCASDECDDPCN